MLSKVTYSYSTTNRNSEVMASLWRIKTTTNIYITEVQGIHRIRSIVAIHSVNTEYTVDSTK